jgi:hypothetical protein
LKLLHVVDEFTREALAIECHRRIDAEKTVATLERLVTERAPAPGFNWGDNWPELTATAHRPVSLRARRERVHRAGLAVAEPIRRKLRLQGARRSARHVGPGVGFRYTSRMAAADRVRFADRAGDDQIGSPYTLASSSNSSSERRRCHRSRNRSGSRSSHSKISNTSGASRVAARASYR